jgi:hypothetical protein
VKRKYTLYKVVPQNTSRIIEYADKDGNISSLILDSWSGMSLLNVEKFAQFTEAGETPVAFLGDKPMVGICQIILGVH